MSRAMSVLTATFVAAFSGPLLAMSADDARYIEQEFEGFIRSLTGTCPV